MSGKLGNRPTVWVSSTDKRKNLDDALRYGELRDVFPSIGREYNGPKLIEYARSVLEKSTEEDYLLIIGDPTLSIICAAVMIELWGYVNILRWNREGFKYVPLELDFDNDFDNDFADE